MRLHVVAVAEPLSHMVRANKDEAKWITAVCSRQRARAEMRGRPIPQNQELGIAIDLLFHSGANFTRNGSRFLVKSNLPI